MRRSVRCTTATAVALAVATLAPPASATTRVIDGDHFSASDITMRGQGCVDPGSAPSTPVVPSVVGNPDDPVHGRWVLGWRPASAGFAFGPLAHVDKPSTLDSYDVDITSPNSLYDAIAVAEFAERDRPGVWRGTWRMPEDSRRGWNTLAVPWDAAFQWKHYNSSGQVDDSASPSTLRNLVNDRGGDNRGADVGILSGCDGDPFFMDALTISAGSESTTYDFEGYQTRMSLAARGVKGRSMTIVAGEKVTMSAVLRTAADGTPKAGRVRLDARHPGAKRSWEIANRVVGGDGSLTTMVRPTHTAIIRATYGGDSSTAGSQADFQIRVRTNVVAARSKKQVVEGRTFSIAGRIAPARRASVILQRYVNSKWRNIRKARTDNKGQYRFEMKSTQVGKAFWRVHANAGGGNLANNSVWLWVKTVNPPTPHHHGGHGGHQGGGSPTPSNPTPPPPSTPPPPPPPPGPFRP